ncbi:hypothetical protein R83H12_00340 [Fibrobacteria bacterium R8-3-H12]
MKKSKLTPAIIIISLMMSPINANAGVFWLDIVKEFVTGGIKTIVMPKNAAKGITAAAPATESKPQASKAEAQPSPEDILGALSKLESLCAQDFASNIPCSIGIGKGLSISMARDKAIAKARVEMANSMGTYVKNNAALAAASDIDEDGIIKEAESYISSAKLSTEQLVSGAQQYLSYTYIDEEATEINKGRTVYVTTVLMVMNKDLFKQALEETGKGKPLSEYVIRESRKGIVAIVKNAMKK